MFDKEEKPNASKKETDGVAAFPVHGVGNAVLQAEKGGGREIRLRDKTKPAKAPAGGLRAKTTARPGAAGIFFKKGYPFYPLISTKG